jgi:hypothetical protein
MKSWIVSLIFGMALGGSVVWGFWRHSQNREQAQTREQVEQVQKEKAQLETELASAKQRMVSLQGSPAVEPAPPAMENLATPEAGDESETVDQATARRAFAERNAQQVIERWKTALKLRPDQVTRLYELFKARLQNGEGNAFRSGFDLQKDLLQILTPEQKTQYEHNQNRESQARLELRAYSELSRVQGMFDLTDAQKDQIFQKFATMEQAPPSTGERMNRQARAQQRAEALKGILTPEQLTQYQQSLQNDRGGFRGRGF